jgi:hypothetical protein
VLKPNFFWLFPHQRCPVLDLVFYIERLLQRVRLFQLIRFLEKLLQRGLIDYVPVMKLTDYRLFGRTGVKVSPLTLGCMMFGARTDLDETVRVIDRAIDAGINILDTANVYSRGGAKNSPVRR